MTEEARQQPPPHTPAPCPTCATSPIPGRVWVKHTIDDGWGEETPCDACYGTGVTPILRFAGAYRFLSNFYPAPVVLDAVQYPTERSSTSGGRLALRPFR